MKKMKLILALATAALLASSLSGCVVVPERGYYGPPHGYYYHGGYYDHRW
jgi:hypothetical protein